MRFIPTTTAKVETLKKQAKRLGRNGGGKHAELLNRVARTAGYEHWHHVVLCHRETDGVTQERSLVGTVAQIVAAELAGEARIVVTGSETSSAQPFIVFSTGAGDAWLLDPISERACCLVWHGETQPSPIKETANQFSVLWQGGFTLNGPFFQVALDHPVIGHRAIGGADYPVDELRAFLLKLQSADRTIAQVIVQDDAVDLTEDVVAQLVRSGWSAEDLATAARQGARYSPSRNSVLFPAMEEMLG
ncbi:MAG: hypothetical protein ACREPQ_14800 [Rhodanobacter sp.]